MKKDFKYLKTKAFTAAFPYTLPVLAGFVTLGMAYGVLMQTKGYGFFWAMLMSAVAFCGSMQFVAITLLTIAFNPFQAFLLSLLVNARHLFYGISMLEKYKGVGKVKGFLIYTLCDETFSISSGATPPKDVKKSDFYFAISFLNYIYWLLGTFLGSLIGTSINFNTEGMDFALTALFLVLFLEQWKKKENRIPCIIGLFSTVLCLMVFGEKNLVIPSMVLILAILTAGRNKLCN
ncbi:MAG: AzlC family ABC transporter permease [Lachnospiraceae bacterium]|nr:AzlC family ABC transporter permease [Lachnospiraceae bacterium]